MLEWSWSTAQAPNCWCKSSGFLLTDTLSIYNKTVTDAFTAISHHHDQKIDVEYIQYMLLSSLSSSCWKNLMKKPLSANLNYNSLPSLNLLNSLQDLMSKYNRNKAKTIATSAFVYKIMVEKKKEEQCIFVMYDINFLSIWFSQLTTSCSMTKNAVSLEN